MCTLQLVFLFALNYCVYGSYFNDAITDEIQCRCVPPHLCADNDETANGQGLLDIRFENDQCVNPLDVCCEEPLTESKPSPTVQCGFPNDENIGPRITSASKKTTMGELPWNVLIFTSSAEKDSFLCGGSLIHPQVVLTAAHCISSNELIKVRAGVWNIRKQTENEPHQDQIVAEILIHPQYKPGTLWNDIALLVLDQPFVINNNIGFICLPIGEMRVDEEACVASGWGKRAIGKKRQSAVLRKVTLPLVSRNKCQNALRGTRLGKGFKLHRGFMCAGGERNKDTCKGDGGSPLICPVIGEEGRFVQVGVVSWGIGCGEKNTPGVYVNVALYRTWIEKNMKSRNFSTHYYKLEA